MPDAQENRGALRNTRQNYRPLCSRVLSTSTILFLSFYISAAASQSSDGREIRITSPADKAALLEIKIRLLDQPQERDPSVLSGWNDTSDPCNDNWNFVHCNCVEEPDSPFRTLEETSEYCEDYQDARGDLRVLFLEMVGDLGLNQRWLGDLPSEIGNLERLRVLDLRSNAFTGPIPDSFRNLTRLRFLSVQDNDLTGPIPSFFQNFTNLIRLDMNGNDFEGRLPGIGCTPASIPRPKRKLRHMVIKDNEKLCGEVPECMRNVTVDVTNTNLMHPWENVTSDRAGGVCDPTPPECQTPPGCLIQTPEFWTDLSEITFNVTPFFDNESNISKHVVELKPFPVEGGDDDVNGSAAPAFEVTDIDLSVRIRVVDESNGNLSYWLIEARGWLPDGSVFTRNATYNVTFRAFNGAGPPGVQEVSGNPVRVDFSDPEVKEIFNTPFGANSEKQEAGSTLGVSWSGEFVDNETSIVRLDFMMLRVQNSTDGSEAEYTMSIPIGNVTNSTLIIDENDVHLQVDASYYFKLIVYNEPGLSTELKTNSFILEKNDSRFLWNLRYGIMAASVFLVGAVTAVFCLYCIPKVRQNSRFDPDEYLKAFMYDVLDPSPLDLSRSSEPIMHQTDLAFVITDEEASTAQSRTSESAFKELKDIHDMIIRDTYQEFSGYEIHIEGDSFQLAFSSVSSAVRFCIGVQHKFLEFKWSTDVLRLPSCNVVKDSNSKDVIYRGPRVRMAIHWAKKELIVNRVHSFTKHRVFEGPGFETAKELCEAAHGGQILMSHEAWLRFDNDFPRADFPTIQLLGTYRMDSWPEAMPIYNVTQRVGKKLNRTFPYLRKLQLVVSTGGDVNIIAPPIPAKGEMLTFAALKLQTVPDDLESPLIEIPFELISQNAQYFKGHMFSANRREGEFLIVFSKTLDAVRFSYVLQMALVLHNWPFEVTSQCSPSVPGPEQVPLFNGPRVAIGIHSTTSFGVSFVQSARDGVTRSTHYAGHGVNFVQSLARCAHGGQIMLSGRTWTAVQNSLPSRSQSLNLGKHVLDDFFSHPLLLFELLPHDLKERTFPPVKTKQKLEAGYRDSPSIDNDIAIVFVKVEKPQIIRRFEERKDVMGVPEEEMREALAVYHQSVSMFCSIVRLRLGAYEGYECKEPEAGKFTLAFSYLKDAILWSCHIHAELLLLDWPERLLSLEECAEERHQEKVIHRGLRVKIGMAYGRVYCKAPINTGRADYFGQLPNLAARVSSLARPGQVLIHASNGFNKDGIQWITADTGFMLYREPLKLEKDGAAEVAVEVSRLGMFLLRGFNELRMLYQAQPASVAVPGRFGGTDVASMYTTDPHHRTQNTVSRFWNHIRFKKPMKYIQEPGPFLSHNNPPYGPGSSSHSNTESLRPSSPSPSYLGISQSEITGSGKNGYRGVLDTIHTQADDAGRTESEVDLNSNLSPRSPITFPLIQNDHGSTSTPTLPVTSQEGATLEMASLTKHDSANSDEYIISFGTSDTVQRVIPPATRESSEDEAPSPVEYGYQVASLYSNVSGTSSPPDFSFFSQKKDSPDANGQS